MIERLMKRFALSEEGAKGLVRAVAACTVADLSVIGSTHRAARAICQS
mgnify:CR=1 FL=1